LSPEETHRQTDPGAPPAAGPDSPGAAPGEEELRAAYEAELSRITVTDMMAQAAVSLLNIAARRLGPARASGPDGAGEGPGAGGAGAEPDLEQVRDGIDGARALLEILERRIPHDVRPLRDALSQLQMAYAAEVRGAAGGAAQPSSAGAPARADGQEEPPGGGQGPGAGTPEPGEGRTQSGPGPAEASGKLWVPGS